MDQSPQYKSKHYAENREYYAKKNRRWIEDNKQQYLSNAKQYREQNKEKVRKAYEEWAKKNPVHSVWRKMKSRCYSPKSDHYHLYGGRGIKICDRWLGPDGYKNFEVDMGPRPTLKHTIERIDTNGNYEPNNCTWATRTQQQRNRRVNVLVTINGVTKCVAEWSEISGINAKTIRGRLESGWSPEQILSPPNPKFQTVGNTKMSGI